MSQLQRLSVILLSATTVYSSSQFAVCVDSGVVTVDALVDASAMASSKVQDNVFWVCNGHSDNNKFYAIDNNGRYIAAFFLKAKWQRNWEDMASGPGPDPSKTYLYIGDIGDNDAQWPIKTVYRFEEPIAFKKGETVIDTVKIFDKLDYVYSDTIRDAEAMMLDPLTKDYYVISKRETRGRVYRAAFPQPTASADTLELLDSIPYTNINSADISASGDEILLKDYARIYYWKRTPGESIIDALKRTPKRIPYKMEPCGEAVCWSISAGAYFTISEERDSIDCRLYQYQRNPTAVTQTAPVSPVEMQYRWQPSLLPENQTGGFDLSGRALQPAKTTMRLLIHRTAAVR